MSSRIDILPYTDLSHLGDLVDIVFPTTSVYNSSNNIPLVVEWADVGDDEGDIYYLYQTARLNLKLYLQKRLSHFELIQSAVMGIVYTFKGDLHNPKDLTLASVKNIPSSYFPDPDVYFEPEDAYDTEIIEETFSLTSVEEEENVDHLLHESFNIHFKKGKYIGFGEGDAKVVGEVLSNFSALYEEVVTDKHKGVERTSKLTKAQKDTFALERTLNVSGLLAASLSIIVKPKIHIERITFDESVVVTTDADDTFGRISTLIKSSFDIERLLEIKNNFNSKVFNKLEKLAESIRDNELSIDFRYRSIQTSEYFDTNMSSNNSQGVIANIKRIYQDNSTPEEHEGTFDMIHCGTGHFSFISNTEKFRGYFQKGLTDLKALDFKTLYAIRINRTTKKGKQDTIKIIEIDALED